MRSPTGLRRELLLAFGFLFAGAVLMAVLGGLLLAPWLRSPGEAFGYVLMLLAADLAVVFVFGGYLLRDRLVEPVEALVADVRRIAGGEYRRRVGPMPNEELQAIEESVNAMADRLVRDQELLAENVASLEETNRQLVEARDQVVHAARLASVGSLAAGLAHEVGNPLGAIVGYVDVARARAEREGRDTEILDYIREEAERIDRIVRGLLDYARPNETEVAPAAPGRVLERVRKILENQGRLEGVRDRWELAEEDVPRVLMEPHRLEQVMVNLLLNALDALEESPGESIRVSLVGEPGGATRLPPRRASDPPGVNYMHRRRLTPEEAGTTVDPLFTAARVAVVRVEDDGPGIPGDDLDRIFDPFYTTKETGEGTGLGLSVCARLVEGMGGRIEASNREEGGAVFTIRLPGAPPEESEAVGEAGERPQHRAGASRSSEVETAGEGDGS